MGLRPGGLSGSVGPEQITNYTIPGILNFIKHEWTRFERERANWEVERAELQVKKQEEKAYDCHYPHPSFFLLIFPFFFFL